LHTILHKNGRIVEAFSLWGERQIGTTAVELIRFLKEYIASPKEVGGLAPSSHGLAELVTETANVREMKTVVEFGPGTGVFTEVIVRKLRPGAIFFAIEISEEFVRACQERCPNARIIHDSAANVREHMQKMGVESLDCIVSGLPFALFEPSLQEELLDAAHDALKPGGAFVTFTYITSPFLPKGRSFRKRLNKRFSKVNKTSIVWRNFLPAFAYKAVK
jgi:phospholipid N-methyltransferase